MSSLIFQTEEHQVFVATDTLAVSPDGNAVKFTTKAFILPHLRLIIAGTGIGPFANLWAAQVNQGLHVSGIEALNNMAPSHLSSAWKGFKTQLPFPSNATVTIYHFGFSETTGFIKSFVYRSPDFCSEERPYGLGYKPFCTVPADLELPRDVRKMMDDQREREALRPINERVYIGGEIHAIHLTEHGFSVYPLGRFDDYDHHEEAIRANLNPSG